MVLSRNVKGYCNVLAGIITHLTLGNVYTWANINPYYVSYMRMYHPDFKIIDGFFLVPTIVFVQHFVITISGYFEKSSGPRILNIFSFCCVIAAQTILYFFTDLWIAFLAMGIFGVGIGFGYFTILKTCWAYFPGKRGLITGTILCSYGLSSFFFTTLADYVINPDGVLSKEGYFDKEIAERTPTFIYYMIFIMLGLGVIANLLIFPYTEEDTQIKVNAQDNQLEANKNEGVIKEQQEENKGDDIPKGEETFAEAVRARPFHYLLIIVNGMVFFGYVATNTNRSFGSINMLNEKILQTLSKVYSLINGSMRLIWGFVYDKLDKKKIYSVIMGIHMVCAFAYYFAGQDEIAYFITNCLTAVSYSGHTTMYSPLVLYYFGVKNSILLLGVVGMTQGVNGLVAPVICKFSIKERSHFLILYLIGGCFVVCAIIALFLLPKDKYVYRGLTNKKKPKVDTKDIDNVKQPLINESSSGAEAMNPNTSENDNKDDKGN